MQSCMGTISAEAADETFLAFEGHVHVLNGSVIMPRAFASGDSLAGFPAAFWRLAEEYDVFARLESVAQADYLFYLIIHI